jgi:hypothetical protein
LPKDTDRAKYGPDNRLLTSRRDGREMLFVKRGDGEAAGSPAG